MLNDQLNRFVGDKYLKEKKKSFYLRKPLKLFPCDGQSMKKHVLSKP